MKSYLFLVLCFLVTVVVHIIGLMTYSLYITVIKATTLYALADTETHSLVVYPSRDSRLSMISGISAELTVWLKIFSCRIRLLPS